jgi:hypothetical protein
MTETTIVLLLGSITSLSFLASTIIYYIKFRRMIRVIAQLAIDKELLLDKLDKLILENSKEANEGFIKFLSESREAAFEYIENVQKSIQSYLVATENRNQDEILIARMELFSHLPEVPESETKN